MSLSAGTRIGPYEVTGSLGAGGMGEVYRARDTKLDRGVALKILPPSFANDPDRLMRFEREAKTLAALNHPCIAQIYGLEQSGPASTLVMELVEGEDLAQRVARGAVPLDEALPIARQIAEALEAAHEAGIVHRDLKPANIKVRPDGTVKVLDFGLAKALDHGSGEGANSPTITSPAMTMQGMILGTAAYMAPEQAKWKAVDRRADIWAFGCVLYEMLTARRAFDGEDITDTIAAVVTKEPDWSRLPASTPPSVERLLRRCLEKQPANRLPHIGVARLELREEPSIGPMTRSLPAHRRGRDRAAGVVAGAAAVGLAAALFWSSATPTVVAPPPTHVAIPMPSPTTASNGLLLSPDGRYLATRGPSGESMLHTFDGSPPQTLDGIAGCWSPDSRSLALLRANNELVRMDVAGGPAVAFAKTRHTGLGCAWSRDGVLLVHGGGEPFSRLTISDGTLTPVASDDGDGTRRYGAEFLPDGRRFLYWAVTGAGQRTVRAGSIDSPETRHIVASDTRAIYSAGFLLFQRGATLVAQPFDERTLTLSGEPHAITTETAPGTPVTIAEFDASKSGTLAFVTTNGGVRAAQNWVDRDGKLEGSLPGLDGGELLNVALSPDGTRVAGTRMDPATGNWDLWVVDLRSGAPTRVTRQPGTDSDPVWSPDGAELAYVSRREDAHGIYRLSLINGREQLLLKIGVQALGQNDTRPTDWTSDGRFLIYEEDYDIMALALTDPAEPIRLVATPAFEKSGRVSPDGRWIAYHSDDSGDSHVYVRPFLRSGAALRVSTKIAAHPLWRGDGRELFWMGPSAGNFPFDTLFSADLTIDGATVRSAGAKPVLPAHVRMSPLTDSRSHFAVTGDGQRFLLRQADGLPGPAVKMILNWPAMVGHD